jgi:hypothetical protein
VFLQYLVEFIEEHDEPGGVTGFFWGEDHAKGNSDQFPVWQEAHESVAGGGGTGVNSEGECHTSI